MQVARVQNIRAAGAIAVNGATAAMKVETAVMLEFRTNLTATAGAGITFYYESSLDQTNWTQIGSETAKTAAAVIAKAFNRYDHALGLYVRLRWETANSSNFTCDVVFME